MNYWGRFKSASAPASQLTLAVSFFGCYEAPRTKYAAEGSHQSAERNLKMNWGYQSTSSPAVFIYSPRPHLHRSQQQTKVNFRTQRPLVLAYASGS
uniref:Uncharacterized protein n=1 Tax=Glossina brevipalpis TaxID=37001 RepID=A0A1A9WYS7_9MUSC